MADSTDDLARSTRPETGHPVRDAGTPPSRIGPYQIDGRIGRGGGGIVWRARHVETGAAVALKTVRSPDAQLVGAIRREIQALARSRHPDIVRIVDHGVEGGVPWYAMELLAGVTLRARIGARPPLDRESQLTVVRRLCAPLAFLHGEGIVHRDLKPDNILLRPDGSPVLADFGLVVASGGRGGREVLEVGGDAAGTAAYMAPEQGLGILVDARADLYALGCVLYELLTGHPPFRAVTLRDLLLMHRRTPPEPPSRLDASLPSGVDALVLRLLAKDPRDRLGYAEDVAAALDELGAAPDAQEPRPRPRPYLYRTRLAGREHIVASLGEAVTALPEGRGGVVLIGGESGAGKTRLAMEIATMATRLGIVVLAGECEPLGGPLAALRRPLEDLVDLCREEAGAGLATRLFGRGARMLAPYLPTIASLPEFEALPHLAEIPAAEGRIRLLEYLASVLTAAAERQATLLLLDDLQWGDDLLIGLLRHLGRGEGLGRVDGAKRRPLLVVGTYRSEEVSGALQELLQGDVIRRVSLERLHAEDLSLMVSDLLAMRGVPPELLAQLERDSEGNPFFVAEYVHGAVEAGLLARDAAGQWCLAAQLPGSGISLPRSIRELVQRRLTSLPAEARDLATAASVLGREVERTLLAAVASMTEEEMERAAAVLEARRVMEDGPAEALRFCHDKIREVAYESLDGAERVARHRAVAAALEAAAASARPGRAAALAHHWSAAGEPERALPHELTAAREAAKQYAYAEAEAHYRAYLRTASAPSCGRISARLELAQGVLDMTGRAGEAREELELALAEAHASGQAAAEAPVLRALGVLAARSGRYAEAAALHERAIAAFHVVGDAGGEVGTLALLGSCHRELGQRDEARRVFERAHALLGSVSDRRVAATLLHHMAVLASRSGAYAEAGALYARAMATHRELGDRRSEAVALGNMGATYHALGRLHAARDSYEQALAIHREMQDLRWEAITLGNLGGLDEDLGDGDRARARFEEALSIHRRYGARAYEAHILGSLAHWHAARGHIAEADRLLAEAVDIHRALGDRHGEAVTVAHAAGAYREAGRLPRARALLEATVELYRAIGDRVAMGNTLVTLAATARWMGEPAEAARLLEAALPEVARDRLEEARARIEHGHVALARGDSAGTVLDEASVAVAELGSDGGSALGSSLARLRRAQEAFERGAPLFRGEPADDLPPALRREWGAEG